MTHLHAVSTFLVPSLALLTLCGAASSPPGNASGTHARSGAPRAAAIRRVNTSSEGLQANGATDVGALSSDGRFVAFSSVATNLAPGDPTGIRDVFVTDTRTGTTELVSSPPAGGPGNGPSGTGLALSSDGRFVAFDSWAEDLVAGDTNGLLDIFVHDRATGSTARVNVDSAGVEANGASAGVGLSGDGRYVVFSSWADNLVAADTNGVQDVFLHDRVTGITRRVSESSTGVGGEAGSHSPAISPNGAFVAYSTRANNLVQEPLGPYHYIFVFDVASGETWHASVNSFGEHAHADCNTRPAITSDGRFVAFATAAYNLAFPDLNGVSDVFLHDRSTGITTRVSVSSAGLESNGGSLLPTLSDDGRQIAFTSTASNLIAGDQNGEGDVFVHERLAGTTRRASRAPDGRRSNGASTAPILTPDGTHLLFPSSASNLVPADTNDTSDLFLCPLR